MAMSRFWCWDFSELVTTIPVGMVGDPHRRVGGVHVLPARARGPVGVDADIGRVHLDLDIVVDHRIDPDRGKRGVPPRGAVIGRDPHQTVHARFRLQPAIGVVARDLVGRRLDPRLFARAFGLQLDLVAVLLGPADIHARQHRRPVAAFGAARARVDLEEGVVAVGLAVQQRLELLLAAALSSPAASARPRPRPRPRRRPPSRPVRSVRHCRRALA
jgi:hypothetical protein